MDDKKRRALEAAGFRFGDAEDFLGLTGEEKDPQMRTPSAQDDDRNEAAFWQAKDELAKRFPAGWFVAFSDGKVAADASTFDTLRAELLRQGKDPTEVLVAQAGVDYLKEAVIF